MRRPLSRVLVLAVPLSLALAPAAEAMNDGRGLYGDTNDHVVTNAGFILIAFFPIVVIVMSTLQRHLEKRKEARQAAQKAMLGNSQWRGGW
jgi:hypothetical protein